MRSAFACLRALLVIEGNIIAEVTGHQSYMGKLVDMSPILGFDAFKETHRTGPAIARWKHVPFNYLNTAAAIARTLIHYRFANRLKLPFLSEGLV